MDEVARGTGPVGKRESEAGLLQHAWDGAAALQDEFRLGLHEDSTDLEHPACCGKTDRHTPYLAKGLHKLAVRERLRCRHIYWTNDALVLDQEVYGPAIIDSMQPGDILIARTLGTAVPRRTSRERT